MALVLGFASTRSLAWGVARAWSRAGAVVALGVQSERFAGRAAGAAATAAADAAADFAAAVVAGPHDDGGGAGGSGGGSSGGGGDDGAGGGGGDRSSDAASAAAARASSAGGGRVAPGSVAASSRGAWLGPPPLVVTCDVADDASIEAALARVAAAHGGTLHAVLHSVAHAPSSALRGGRLCDTSRADFAATLDVSAFSLLAVARGAAPALARAGGGALVALSFEGARRAVPGYGVMGVAKAALEAGVRGLAEELGPAGVRVNALAPGPVDTLAARGLPGFGALRAAAAARAPLRRGTTLDDVGAAATWLASDGGRGVTGQVISVDCGMSILSAYSTAAG